MLCELQAQPDVPQLTQAELEREHEINYDADDPNVPQNITRYDFKEKAYKKWNPKNITAQIHMCVHFSMAGSLILRGGDEAKAQGIPDVDPEEEEAGGEKLSKQAQSAFDDIEAKFAAIDEQMNFAEAETTDADLKAAQDGDAEGEAAEKEAGEAKVKAADEEDEKKDDKYSKNQFNFSDRSYQTTNNPARSKEVATRMPPAAKFSTSVYAWTIYDRYVAEARKAVAKRHENDKKGMRNQDKSKKKKKQEVLTYTGTSEEQARSAVMKNPKALLIASTLERLVVQNTQKSAFLKFKFTTENDERDSTEPNVSTGRGSFEPLWNIKTKDSKGKTVTAVAWNPKYSDMFAVSYGSYEFEQKDTKGIVYIFTLKNTENPMRAYKLPSGVMCLDFHPNYSNLLACGMYDGTVCVFDITQKSNEPMLIADDPKRKHWEPVWQVKWKAAQAGKANIFTSISSDGRVVDWSMEKTELANVEVMALKAVERLPDAEEDEKADTTAVAGGTCFDIRSSGDLFVIGTEEGAVRTYSKNYDTECKENFRGHRASVYAARWNPFNPRVFLTCSEDWCVSIWHLNCAEPIFKYNLGTSVGDVVWAPYSSTAFACVTTDNVLRLYDINVDKNEPIGEMQLKKLVKKKNRLTHLAINPKEPVLAVGDERGTVQLFKLSPNLRKMTAFSVDKLQVDVETAKLDDVLILDGKVNKTFRISDVGKREEKKVEVDVDEDEDEQ